MADLSHKISAGSPTFWLGLLLGIFFAWVIYRLIVSVSKGTISLRKNFVNIRENLTTSSDVRLRNDVYRFSQKQHLAASLFSLEEIAVTPKVLLPTVQASKSTELAPTDSVSLTVPYMPDWPEMAAAYRATCMTLVEALQGGANIILGGHPGSGKTVALAWLAAYISQNKPGLGTLEGYLPLYIHATDIYHFLRHVDEDGPSETSQPDGLNSSARTRPKKAMIISDSLDIMVRAISTYASPLTITKLPSILRTALEKQRAILIIDRADELPPSQAHAISSYLQNLLENYPHLRIIIALSYDDLAGLPALGFSLLALADWGDEERDFFLNRWSKGWNKWLVSPEKRQAHKIYSYYLNSWLKVNNSGLKPLEYMLKVWAAYSGDILGTDGPSAIESYIRRVTGNETNSREGLEFFALQVLKEMGYRADPHNIHRVFKNKEPEAKTEPSEDSLAEAVMPQPTQPVKPLQVKELSEVGSLVDNGLLVSYSGANYGFSHPLLAGYLAGSALASTDTAGLIQDQPAWIGKTLAMYYFARLGDVTPFINQLIQDDDILHTNHLTISRWLQIAPKNRQWRTTILRTLATILNKEKDTLGLAGKIISALALSGDAGISIYFRQLLKSEHPILKQLAALGSGILGDKKSAADLALLMQEDSPGSIRAASLALAAIGDKQSLEFLATTLLNGSEIARRCAAEALANNPVEGHPALKDGSTMEDLLVRRSVAFGLIRVNQPWAIKIVENLQLEDNEWVVRNAALQAFDEYRRRNNYAPKLLPDPTEMEWLVNYATRVGTKVAPGKPGEDLIAKALANGTQDEIINALDYLRIKCDPETISYISGAYSNNVGDIKDIAYYILWLMLISGEQLPVAVKYDIK